MSKDIEIRYIGRTLLDEHAYKKFVRKYSNNIKNNIIIIFDLRLVNYGLYYFDKIKNKHTIKISPVTVLYTRDDVKLDDTAVKYNLIESTIHELRHAHQQETTGRRYNSPNYIYEPKIRNPNSAEYFSKSETDARLYECKHIHKAVDYYDSCCKKK